MLINLSSGLKELFWPDIYLFTSSLLLDSWQTTSSLTIAYLDVGITKTCAAQSLSSNPSSTTFLLSPSIHNIFSNFRVHLLYLLYTYEVSPLCVFAYAPPACIGLWRVSRLGSSRPIGRQTPSCSRGCGPYWCASLNHLESETRACNPPVIMKFPVAFTFIVRSFIIT